MCRCMKISTKILYYFYTLDYFNIVQFSEVLSLIKTRNRGETDEGSVSQGHGNMVLMLNADVRQRLLFIKNHSLVRQKEFVYGDWYFPFSDIPRCEYLRADWKPIDRSGAARLGFSISARGVGR